VSAPSRVLNPRLAYCGSEKHPLNLHFLITHRGTQVANHAEHANMPFTTTGIGMYQLLYRISVDCITLPAMKNITKTEVIFVKFIPLWYTTLKHVATCQFE